jgi:hypothetical protein
MGLIQLTGRDADRYRAWLAYFARSGVVTFRERTEAFFAARRGDWPGATQ